MTHVAQCGQQQIDYGVSNGKREREREREREQMRFYVHSIHTLVPNRGGQFVIFVGLIICSLK